MRRRWLIIGAAVVLSAGVAVAVAVLIARRRSPGLAPDGIVDSEQARRTGSPADRGRVPVLGIDVERLRDIDGFEPAVEYLTYIQTRRGTSEHLLFVRNEDLDAIAALEGDDLKSFLDRLQHLGVVVSPN